MSNCAQKRICRTTSARYFSRFPSILIPILQAIILVSTSPAIAQDRQTGGQINNDAFLSRGLENCADTLLEQAGPHLNRERVYLDIAAPRFADKLTNIIAQRLQRSGNTEVFLKPLANGDYSTFETRLDAITLTYVGIGRGVLRFPAVERKLQFDGFGRVLDSEGKLLSTFAVADLVFSDTLSYADAEAASGQGAFLSPPLPPSPYRRLVEPGLVLAVTGAVVYVFFASR